MQLQDFNTLALAKLYIKDERRMTSPDMLISFLTLYDCVTSLQTSTDEKAKGFNLALLAGVKEFNLMSDHPVGQAQIQLLSWLVSVGAVNQSFYDACYNYANYQRQPFLLKTEHEFQLAKGTIPRVRVTLEQGYCRISVSNTSDIESHRPQVSRRTVFANGDKKFDRVATFETVSIAKIYEVACPNFGDLWVDDAYNVISQA
tara:strand:- start:151 stop:756 length:606 start_codon:yes stop_codon:yes gene_type:complete